jgi:predicted phage terminase large subunit-like protein
LTLLPPNCSSVSWSDLTPALKAGAKSLCEDSHLYFTRLFFKEIAGSAFRVGAHHKVMANVLDRVLSGEINRLIINVPPGYTKTEEAVIAFIARGMAKNPRARFIHASFSGELVNENSVRIKDVMASEPYRDLWGINFKADQDAKGLWRTNLGGGLLAKPAGGPITGFRAGLMEEGFTGAFVIDDPLKPDDAFSQKKRDAVNNRWHSTFKSRLAHEGVPVIVVMQRLHVDDFSGYLLKGGAGCKWHHLMLPMRVDRSQAYPTEYTHGIPIDHGLPDGPLWSAKHTEDQIKILEFDAYTFASQAQQVPTILGGNLFKDEWLIECDPSEVPSLQYRGIYADTAQKVGAKNDYTVMGEWGLGYNGIVYYLDKVRGKFEAPELLSTAAAFWNKCKARPTNVFGVLRSFNVEDKVSGTGLIQHMARLSIPVLAIKRGPEKDKYTRALDAVPSFAAGLVRIVDTLPGLGQFRREMLGFDGTEGNTDDEVDTVVDAVVDMLGGGVSMDAWT